MSVERSEPPPGGKLFWAAVLIGWATMAFAVAGALAERRDTRPPVLLSWLAGSVLVHDFIWLPVVALVGVLIRRAFRGRTPAAVRWALATSAVLVLIAWPFVRGYGRSAGNPSLLPRNYAFGLLAYLGVTWLIATAVLVVGRTGQRRNRRGEA